MEAHFEFYPFVLVDVEETRKILHSIMTLPIDSKNRMPKSWSYGRTEAAKPLEYVEEP